MLRFEISRYFRRSVTLSTVYSHFVVPVHSFYLIYQFSSFHLPAYCPPFSDHFSQYFHLYCHICDIVPSPFYFSFSFLPRFFLFLFFFANASPPPFCVIVYTSLLLYFPSSVPFLREIYNVPSQSNFSSSQRRNNLDANSRPGTPSSESHLRESDPWRELRSRKSNDDVRLRALLCCSIRKPVLPSPNLPLILTFADFHSNYVIRML